MKKVYIVHGWGGSPKEPHIALIKEEAERHGFTAYALSMPDTNFPTIPAWVGKLRESVETPDQDTYFIAHSIGGQAVMRYLETLPEDTKIGGVIFLAGWFVLTNLEGPEEEEVCKPWVETPINFASLRTKTKNYTAILSDNDTWVPLEVTKEKFEKSLGATVLVEHGKGHFTEDDGIIEVPTVIGELQKMVGAT